jgi:hypothetical protein
MGDVGLPIIRFVGGKRLLPSINSCAESVVIVKERN